MTIVEPKKNKFFLKKCFHKPWSFQQPPLEDMIYATSFLETTSKARKL